MILAALALALTPDANAGVDVVRISAQLFLEETGQLSDDILARPKPFAGWNTLIGEGDAPEASNDILVTVRLAAINGAEQRFPGPVLVSAFDGTGKRIAFREWRDVLTSTDGKVALPLWVQGTGCAGQMRVTVQFNGNLQSRQITLFCGE